MEETLTSYHSTMSPEHRKRLDEIASEIYGRAPHVKTAGEGCDFRPGGHRERICSGLCVSIKQSPDMPITFRVMLGGVSLALKAWRELSALGISAAPKPKRTEALESDGEGVPAKVTTWQLKFTLPWDWRVPKLPMQRGSPSFQVAMVENLPDESLYPFKNGDVVLLLGDISQMPGHVVIVTRDQRTIWGYHSEHFRVMAEDEV